MIASEAKFARIHDRKSFFAEVAIELHPNSTALSIEFKCSGEGFYSQGYVEDASAVGYDHWKAGAKVGVEFALSVAGKQSFLVTITRISGLHTDTNPSVVAAAAALAVWRALEFQAPLYIKQKMEEIVFISWEKPDDEPPNFS